MFATFREPPSSSFPHCWHSEKSASGLRESFFDLIVDRKSPDFSFREDYLAIDNYIELAAFAGLHLRIHPKTGIK
jgi:hypothetical protein